MTVWGQRRNFELVQLGNRDANAALAMLEELSELGVSIPAEVALHVAVRCLQAEPPPKPRKRRGRPTRTFPEMVLRFTDGKAAIEGKKLSKSRSPRDIERCMAEYRKLMARIDSDAGHPPEKEQN